MRICVTGASGFIGRHLVRRLMADGHEVVTVPEASEVVYHLASTPLAASVSDEEHERAIVGGMRALLDRLHASPPARLIFTGSAAEYGSGHGWREEDSPRPDTFFGACKRKAGEMALDSGIPAVHLRLFTPYGEGEAPGRLVRSAVEAAQSGAPLTLRSDGTQTRDYFWVGDLVDALVAAAVRPLPPAVVINIATGTATRAIDVARRVFALAGRDPSEVRPGTEAPAYLAASSGACERARALLGWHPRVSLDEGIRRLLAQTEGANYGTTSRPDAGLRVSGVPVAAR